HGKTALVTALTGTNTDRLKEEQERGISIELGFAELDLGDGVHLGVVDMPGHEKFVKQMVSGAGGVDLAFLVIAADEGVMPQTIEHLAILDTLGVRGGIVVIAKIDMVDWIELFPFLSTRRPDSSGDGKDPAAVREAISERAADTQQVPHSLLKECRGRVPDLLDGDRRAGRQGHGYLVHPRDPDHHELPGPEGKLPGEGEGLHSRALVFYRFDPDRRRHPLIHEHTPPPRPGPPRRDRRDARR
ncbi:MAG: hypothetical protein HGB17_06540, partial [Syntrophobacteraceae bacterium]|nr:hypothetical protein [Syntrophobacteraceae bacterium]